MARSKPRKFPRSLPGATLILAVLPLPAQVTLAPGHGDLVSEQTRILQVSHRDGQPRDWRWALPEPHSGSLKRLTGGRAAYRPPWVPAPRTYAIQVTEGAGGPRSVFQVRVVPPEWENEAFRHAMDMMTKVHGPTWDRPQMTRFAGRVAGEGEPFDQVSGVVRVEDPEMRGLHGHYLVTDRQGLWAVAEDGSRLKIAFRGQLAPALPFHPDPEDFPAVACTAVAVRPPGDHRANLRRHPVVALTQTAPGPTQGQTFLCALWPDGTVIPIMGSPFVLEEGGDGERTPRRILHFEPIRKMVMDGEGNLFTVDRFGRVDRIAPDGSMGSHMNDGLDTVETWSFVAALGQWRPDLLGPRGMIALDPATGDLLATQGNSLKRFPAGRGIRRNELGTPAGMGFLPSGLGTGTPMPPMTACLDRPTDLTVHEGIIYVVDRGNHCLRAFNPATRALHTLVGHASQPVVRCGPLGAFARTLPPEACAALADPVCLCVHGGTCVVGLAEGLVRLDLPPGAFL